MALQGDVLAAYGLGIQNLIVVGSEDIAYCDHQDMKTVNDLDELGLIGAIRSLEQGVDLAGLELNGTPSFIVGCTMAQWADEPALDRELEATRKKVEAGAGFVVTPAVYDLNLFRSFMDRAQGIGSAHHRHRIPAEIRGLGPLHRQYRTGCGPFGGFDPADSQGLRPGK